MKPTAVGTPAYSAVPNSEGSPTLGQSPDPNRDSVGYSDNQFLSPDADTHMLRPESGIYPAPSIISSRANRDSVIGTPNLGNDNRSSWGSNAAFAAAGAGAAGEVCLFIPFICALS
jgi:glucan 1,3-beta-glucosidase